MTDDDYLRAKAASFLVMVHTKVGVPDLLHVLPPLGARGWCADYDEDCYFLPDGLPRAAWEWRWARCFMRDPDRGPCPFID